MSLLELFCDVDDFCQTFEPEWYKHLLHSEHIRRVRPCQLSTSEIMTLVIHFHQSHYRDFKAYYTDYVCGQLRREFPRLVSYQRFVELMPRVLIPLLAYFHHVKGYCTGVSFVDATSLAVCHNRRIARHQVLVLEPSKAA